MRTAKDWFEEELSGEPLTQESVIECIKMVQEEVIKETVEECAEKAEINFSTNDKEYISDIDFSFRDCDGNWCKISINEDTIYSVADKLIKGL